MQIEPSSLIMAITGLAALVWGIIQSNRSRRDTKEQQAVANELSRREQDWEELREERAANRELRNENASLHRQLRQRDELILFHRKWDVDAYMSNPELGNPPPLYPST